MGSWEMVGLQGVYCILAIVTAIVFWRFLPKSSQATFKAKTIKAGGAFAAFLIVYFMLYWTGPLQSHVMRLESEVKSTRMILEKPLSEIIKNQMSQIADGQKEKYSPSVLEQPSKTYSGLVIDTKGLQLIPGLAPRILTPDNRLVYGAGIVDSSLALQSGITLYAATLKSASFRSGPSPLTVKAVSVANGTDVIVSLEDASRIVSADRKDRFLREGRVAFVLD